MGFSSLWPLLLWSTGSRVHGLSSCLSWALMHGLSSCGHARRFSCFVACGIFPDKGLNPCLLHWQADSLHWVLVAVDGLSLVVASRGYSLLQCADFSLQWFHLLQSTGFRCTGSLVEVCDSGARRLQEFQLAGSVVVAHGLSCFVACGILLDQGSNPCSLHWQVDS